MLKYFLETEFSIMISFVLLLAICLILATVYVTWLKNGRNLHLDCHSPLLIPKVFGFGVTFNPNNFFGLSIIIIIILLILLPLIQSLHLF